MYTEIFMHQIGGSGQEQAMTIWGCLLLEIPAGPRCCLDDWDAQLEHMSKKYCQNNFMLIQL